METRTVNTSNDPKSGRIRKELNRSLLLLIVWGAIAVYVGIRERPPMIYTAVSAMVGVAFVALTIVEWRTRREIWRYIAIGNLVLLMLWLPDRMFFGQTYLQKLYYVAVVLTVWLLFMRIFRRPIARFCQLDGDTPAR